jgi:hypothetical protein
VRFVELARIRVDLLRHLRNKTTLISSDFSAVVEDVSAFTFAIIHNGFDEALSQLPTFTDGLSERPFIEVADVIGEHHLRFVHGADRDTVRKSLLEAYIHAAGPRHVLGPPRRTRLVHCLRRRGARNFAALLFSLHLFNVITMAMDDDLALWIPELSDFELYMVGVETICRAAVKVAVDTEGSEVDGRWARAVAKNVEAEMRDLSHRPQIPVYPS